MWFLMLHCLLCVNIQYQFSESYYCVIQTSRAVSNPRLSIHCLTLPTLASAARATQPKSARPFGSSVSGPRSNSVVVGSMGGFSYTHLRPVKESFITSPPVAPPSMQHNGIGRSMSVLQTFIVCSIMLTRRFFYSLILMCSWRYTSSFCFYHYFASSEHHHNSHPRDPWSRYP